MEVTTFGALFGLFIAILLIIRNFPPVYALMLGALVGGICGGVDLSNTIEYMVDGTMGISPSILRVLASGVLAGCLIKTHAVDKISEEIIRILGEKNAFLGIALSSFALAFVGINLDVVIITVAPIGLYIGSKLNYSTLSILLTLLGGGKAGNIISPNPNTLAAADNFSASLSSVMMSNVLPALVGVLVTVLLARLLANKGSKVTFCNDDKKEDSLPSLASALAGPLVSMVLLFLGNVSNLYIDPLVALPVGGIVCLLATGKIKFINEYLAYGVSQMQGVCILLLGTGALAGIIQMSTLQESTISILEFLSVPQFLLAPISGVLMSLATASSTAGATIASSTFSGAILDSGVTNIAGASMVNAGASVFEQLPHGSLFNTSGNSVNMILKERFKLIPYEAFIGFVMTSVSTLVHLF